MLVESLKQEDSFGRLFFLSVQSYLLVIYLFFFGAGSTFHRTDILEKLSKSEFCQSNHFRNTMISYLIIMKNYVFWAPAVSQAWTELYFHPISFSSLYAPMWQLLLKIPFYRFGNRVLEWLGNFSKVIQLMTLSPSLIFTCCYLNTTWFILLHQIFIYLNVSNEVSSLILLSHPPTLM